MDAAATVLLVMDYQNDLVHKDGKFSGWGIAAHVESKNAIENTAQVISKAREQGVKIIYITVSHDENYSTLQKSHIPMYKNVQEAKALIQGQWGAEIHDMVKPKEGDVVLNKTRINPFTIPELRSHLQGKTTLLLAGVATNFVVEECARTAAAEDFEVIVLEDCCASMSQEMHDFPIKNILPNLVKVVDSKDVLW